MSYPSNWPLPPKGIRIISPQFLIDEMAHNPLTRNLYPRSFGYYPQAAGHSMERLEHDDYVFLYCVEGYGEVWVDEKMVPVSPGDLMLFQRGQAHRYHADKELPWTIYWSHFDGKEVEAYLKNIGLKKNEYLIHMGIHPKIISDLQSLMEGRHTGYDLKTYIYASNLLRQILSYMSLVLSAKRVTSLDLDFIRTQMRQKIEGKLNLDELVAKSGLSKYHFIRRYKEQTGYSPIQHFIHLKMEWASYLLDISNKNITEIADQMGYEDVYYFSRLFKKITGLSPREYRNKN